MKNTFVLHFAPYWKSLRKYILPTAIAFSSVVLLGILVVVLIYNAYSDDLPSFEQLHNIQPRLITKVYSDDGRLIKEFYRERRILISYKDIPESLKSALLATEDRRFYEHWGVDIFSVFRALFVNIYQGEKVQGGSTLTQQLARTLFLTPEKIYTRKLKEVLTAIKLERTYSKNEIMAMYLNQHNFGSGAYGIQSAAQYFFGKDTRELNNLEAATLVALLKAPNRYSPVRYPERTRQRRNVVINSMVDHGVLSPVIADSLKREPMNLYKHEVNISVGAYFTEMIRRYLEKNYGEGALYDSGNSVYTTLNYQMQRTAEEILHTMLDSLQNTLEISVEPDDEDYTIIKEITTDGDTIREYKKLQGALVCLDNRTGGILALVGGRDFSESKWNRAVQATRQPGSAFKPFVYTVAIDNGFQTTYRINDSPIVIPIGDDEYRPHNIDFAFKGIMTLREGLSKSRNLVAIKLIMEPHVTPQQTVFYAHQMGIKSPLLPVPSLAIGTCEVTLIELTTAYSTFPNGGIRTEPFYITKLVDNYGGIIEERTQGVQEEVLSSQTAYIMTDMLQSVINAGTGIGARSRGFTKPAGGKTGTTDNWTDNWFMGFVPQITTGVWVGFDDKTKIGFVEKGLTGSQTALPVWTEFMKSVLDTVPVEEFKMPAGIVEVEVCPESGLLPNKKCPEVIEEVFRMEDAPAESCNLDHREEYIPQRERDLKEKEKRESTRRIRF